jgi:diaminopropionate ammonia-lyase
MAAAGIESGETGAASLAGLLELLAGAERAAGTLAVDEETGVLLISTEGATDPDAYRRILGR